jgi:hypothetical protein
MVKSSSLPFGLGLAGVGAVLIASGVTGNSLSGILQGDFSRSSSGGTNTNDTSTPTSTTSTTSSPTTNAPSPLVFGTKVPTYPSLANKSMSWLLANGYTKDANGNVISTKAVSTK